ncbi:DUF4367 domain-containing protein [Paenibacillus terreus]|uniref:DUF4367 domain-containing protein n=1 Tax=Paenibacillus terreus TaxID=1387834 RepID=A0ABV5B8D2_9BACL
MRELPGTVQDESLKGMDLLPEESSAVHAFDVTDKVMARVQQKSRQQPGRIARMRLRPGITLPVMLLIFAVGLSVTGYAASQYLEFRNSRGEVILNTDTAEEADELNKKYTELFHMYQQAALNQLQPGEYAAYYVKDDFINSRDQWNPVKFVYKEGRFLSPGSLQNEIERTQAPPLNIPSKLPEGYQFDYGDVYPAALFPELLKNDNYRALKDDLVRRAESAPASEKVFIQKLNWEKADAIVARYVKGNDYINIRVSNIDSDTKGITVYQNEQDTAEKLMIHGQQAFYIRSDGEGQLGFKNRLGWRDDSRHLFYEIIDNRDSELNKLDLVKIAEHLLASH